MRPYQKNIPLTTAFSPDVEGKRIVAYREPHPEGYALELPFFAASTRSPGAFPDLKIAIRDLFA